MLYHISYFYTDKRGGFGVGYIVNKVKGEMTLSKLNNIMSDIYDSEHMTGTPVVISWQTLEEE